MQKGDSFSPLRRKGEYKTRLLYSLLRESVCVESIVSLSKQNTLCLCFTRKHSLLCKFCSVTPILVLQNHLPYKFRSVILITILQHHVLCTSRSVTLILMLQHHLPYKFRSVTPISILQHHVLCTSRSVTLILMLQHHLPYKFRFVTPILALQIFIFSVLISSMKSASCSLPSYAPCMTGRHKNGYLQLSKKTMFSI